LTADAAARPSHRRSPPAPTTTGFIGDLAEVRRPDGASGRWHPGLDADAIRRERTHLRDAAFTLVVGLSMMRDSEIHEITKNSIIDHYGYPAITSTKQKHDPNLPDQSLVDHRARSPKPSRSPNNYPAPRSGVRPVPPGGRGRSSARHLHDRHVHRPTSTPPAPGPDWTKSRRQGPAAHVPQDDGDVDRPVRRLRDCPGYPAQARGSRALANRCTQGYAAADISWAEHLDSAIEAARFRRLKDLYTAHKPVSRSLRTRRRAHGEGVRGHQETVKAARDSA